MSVKQHSQKKWFRSAFSQENACEGPQEKRSRSTSFSQSCSQDEFSLNSSQKKSQSSTSYANCTFNSSNWIENFSPNNAADLAMHPKKISEVQDWFLHCEAVKKKYPAQMLLITGPAGSGKTATVKAIAKEMNCEIVEWVTPLDIDLVNDNDEATFKESQVEVFKRFLFRSSRYKSLFESQERRVILVEDFPNVFINDSEGFNEILESYRTYGKSPIIFIATDSKSKKLNISYNFFSDQVRQQFGIVQISFNPVSTTLMKKALKRVCSIMNQEGYNQFYKVPSQEVIESINLASQGDIRNGIINLHFASQKGSSQLLLKSQSQSKTSKSQGKAKIPASIGRDESITMMHALGRVFNPKYEGCGFKHLVHSPENIAESFSSEPRSFVDFVHANYLSHFSSIENVILGIDSISQSDVLLNEYRENQITHLGLNIAIRGVMVSNEKPMSGWMPVKGPKREKKEISLKSELNDLGITGFISRSILAEDLRMYAKIIKSV